MTCIDAVLVSVKVLVITTASSRVPSCQFDLIMLLMLLIQVNGGRDASIDEARAI